MKKSKKLKSKPKYSVGATLNEYQQPIAQGAGIAGQLTQAVGGDSEGAQTAGGALNGLAAGAAFGPVGMVGGALVGGVTSYLSAEKRRKANQTIIREKQDLITKNLMNNAGNALAKGGKLNNLPKKFKVIKGGELNPISEDAVEVKANNPHETDSVELKNAYVDHNEIIDNENRVFSDELGYAKRAKKLEKQKNENPRFSNSNRHIDEKLDNLFQEQEETKEYMKAGGKIKMLKGGRLRLTGPFPMKKLDNKDQFAIGGEVGDPDEENPDRFKFSSVDDPYSYDNSINSSLEKSIKPIKTSKSKLDINKGLTGLATYGPNVISAIAQKRLTGPATPQLERAIGLKRFNADSQLVQADLEGQEANQLIKNNTAQAGDIASATGNILAKKLYNKNQINQNINNQNAQIQAQEAGLNVGIGGRNADRISNYTQGISDFNNLNQKLTSENVSNLSTKILQQGREKSQIQLDKNKELIRSYAFKDSGVQDRWQDQLKKDDPESYKKLFGMAKGGKLKRHYLFGGGDSPQTKKSNSSTTDLSTEFKPISWKSQGVTDSTGLGTMYKTTYGALNRLNRAPIPNGMQPNDETYIQNPLGLQGVINNKKAVPALDIAGNNAPVNQGQLAHFDKGGRLKKPKDRRRIPEMTDNEILNYTTSQGLAKGGKIHIKPENKGKFTAYKKRTGKTTNEALHSKDPHVRKMANFARNAKKWHHEEGGRLGVVLENKPKRRKEAIKGRDR